MDKYANIKKVLGEMTPNSGNGFAPEIYSYDDVRQDEDLLRAWKFSPKYQEIDSDHSSKLLEYAFTHSAETSDWFYEEKLYANDPDWQAFTTVPTSEIDDVFNHVDAVGLISNEITGHKTMPFAIDLTYNTDADKIKKKFNWVHVRGKKESSNDKSEFGESWTERTEQGTFTTMTKSLPLKEREGLKIPGFASVKYFEDTNGTDMLPKGRIQIMPRFIVGFNPGIASILMQGASAKEYATANQLARWCTLIELCEQSKSIKTYLDALPEEKTKHMDAKEFSIAKEQIKMANEYFSKSLQEAENASRTNSDILLAKFAAERDFVCQTILAQTKITFNPPSSEHHRFFVSHM